MRLLSSILLASTSFTPLGLCSMATGADEAAAGGGGTATDVGGTNRVSVGNDGTADASRTAESTGVVDEAQRPEGLPEGFDTVEAFVKAVNDGTYKPAAPEGTAETAKTAEAPEVDPKVAEAFADPRIAPFAEEFTKSGDLSAESVTKAAEALGVPEGLVRAYVDAQKVNGQASVTVQSAPFHQAVGGADQWSAFQAWTGEEGNLAPDVEKAYMGLIAQGKTAEALAVIQPAVSAWKAAGGGAAPRDITNTAQSGPGTGATDVFDNWAQVQAAMNDPKYATDSAYRKGVEEKMARSPNI